MPTAMNSRTFAIPVGTGGETTLPSRHSAPENPLIRYAVPHQASAWMRSCIHANSRKNPSNAVTQVAMTNSVPMSSDIDASAKRAIISGGSSPACRQNCLSLRSRVGGLLFRLCRVCRDCRGFSKKTPRKFD
jgi:hypothetical protein